MRLDHLLSKEESKGFEHCWIFANHEWLREQNQIEAMRACSQELIDDSVSISDEVATEKKRSFLEVQSRMIPIERFQNFRCRCAYGKHPFPSRTRRLRRRRPMVLCWRRHGRAGGCRDYKKSLEKSVLDRTDTFEWAERKAKPVMERSEKSVLTWVSRAMLFHITGFYQWSECSSDWAFRWLINFSQHVPWKLHIELYLGIIFRSEKI